MVSLPISFLRVCIYAGFRHPQKGFLNKLLVSHSKEAFENEFQMLLFSNVEVKQVKYSSTMISLSIN